MDRTLKTTLITFALLFVASLLVTATAGIAMGDRTLIAMNEQGNMSGILVPGLFLLFLSVVYIVLYYLSAWITANFIRAIQEYRGLHLFWARVLHFGKTRERMQYDINEQPKQYIRKQISLITLIIALGITVAGPFAVGGEQASALVAEYLTSNRWLSFAIAAGLLWGTVQFLYPKL
jgi:hypothetical protein